MRTIIFRSLRPLMFLLVLVSVSCDAKADDHRIFTDTIPIQWKYNHIIMPVVINHEVKQLAFDTGASSIFLWGYKGSKPFRTKWIEDASTAHYESIKCESGLVLTEIGSQCDSLIAGFKELPSDTSLGSGFLSLVDGVMGFCPLIRRGLNYFVKVDLRRGFMVISNDHRQAANVKGVKVRYKKCDALPTFNVTIEKKHKVKVQFDSGAAHFCNIKTDLLDKWCRKDKGFSAKKVYDSINYEYVGLGDTVLIKRRLRAYKCDFNIKSFKIKDVVIFDNPYRMSSLGSEIFQKAVVIFDPWHRKIIFQPYD